MSEKVTVSSRGIGFTGLLTVLFIGLKLTNHIDWSWWLVLSPILFSISLTIFLFFIAGVIILLGGGR